MSIQRQLFVSGFEIWTLNLHTQTNDQVLFGDSLIKRKKEFRAPVNSQKPGKVVKPEDTTPYSAMQLNLNPLMAAFG